MKALSIFLSALIILMAACQPKIDSFEDCIAAGKPVLETYPRQCQADGTTYVEAVNGTIEDEIPKEDDSEDGSTGELAQLIQCTDEQKEADFCTRQYDPVCAIADNNIRCVTEPCQSTDAETFGNACTACSSKRAFGYYQGACEEMVFVVCKDAATGFNPREYAEDNNGACVDICPGNYDPFTTQIGAEVCIAHYGTEEIESWRTCDRNSNTCDCAKAYETTTGDQIPDAQYRCVPKMYADRLLFRAGVDRLDESGQSSVAIA